MKSKPTGLLFLFSYLCDDYVRNCMKRILLFSFLVFHCNSEFNMDVSKHKSSHFRTDSSFKSNQREVHTVFTAADFEQPYKNSSRSCREVLSVYFYSNIFFQAKSNILVSYSGKKITMPSVSSAAELTEKIIAEIAQMELGSEEYKIFIKDK